MRSDRAGVLRDAETVPSKLGGGTHMRKHVFLRGRGTRQPPPLFFLLCTCLCRGSGLKIEQHNPFTRRGLIAHSELACALLTQKQILLAVLLDFGIEDPPLESSGPDTPYVDSHHMDDVRRSLEQEISCSRWTHQEH